MPISTKTVAVANRGTGYPDFQMNIRPLDSGDVAHEPLPYEDKTVNKIDRSSHANGVIYTVTFTKADWGEGDYYIETLSFIITAATQFMDANNEGLWIYLTAGGTTILSRTFAFPENSAVWNSAGSQCMFSAFIWFPIRKIQLTETLTVVIQNVTGATITETQVFINGMPS